MIVYSSGQVHVINLVIYMSKYTTRGCVRDACNLHLQTTYIFTSNGNIIVWNFIGIYFVYELFIKGKYHYNSNQYIARLTHQWLVKDAYCYI